MNRQRKILLFCLVGLLFALAYSYLRSPEQGRIVRTEGDFAKGGVTRNKTAIQRDQGTGEETLPRLRLETEQDQEGLGAHFVQSGKDLFAPLYSGGMQLSPSSAAQRPPAVPVAQPEKKPADFRPAVASAPVVEPSVQPARFEVLGYLEIENRRVVFLETAGEVFLARKGESFGDEFRVTDMYDERLVISQRGVPQPITLQLQNKQGVTQLGGAGSFSGRAPNAVPGTRRFR